MTNRLFHYKAYSQGRWYVLSIIDDATGITVSGTAKSWDDAEIDELTVTLKRNLENVVSGY